jgi:hypothetical protein
MGGTIGVKSEVGAGSAFTFTIRVDVGPPAIFAPEASASAPAVAPRAAP